MSLCIGWRDGVCYFSLMPPLTSHLSPKVLGRKAFSVLKVDLLTGEKMTRLFSFRPMDWQIILSGYTQQCSAGDPAAAPRRTLRFSLTVIVALGTDPSAQKHMVKAKFRIFRCYNQNKMHAFFFLCWQGNGYNTEVINPTSKGKLSRFICFQKKPLHFQRKKM